MNYVLAHMLCLACDSLDDLLLKEQTPLPLGQDTSPPKLFELDYLAPFGNSEASCHRKRITKYQKGSTITEEIATHKLIECIKEHTFTLFPFRLSTAMRFND